MIEIKEVNKNFFVVDWQDHKRKARSIVSLAQLTDLMRSIPQAPDELVKFGIFTGIDRQDIIDMAEKRLTSNQLKG